MMELEEQQCIWDSLISLAALGCGLAAPWEGPGLCGVMLQERQGRSRLVLSALKRMDLAVKELQTSHQLEEQPHSQPSRLVPTFQLSLKRMSLTMSLAA